MRRGMGPAKTATAARYYRRLAATARTAGDTVGAARADENADRLEAALDRQVRCRVCGTALTDPDSRRRRVGPECIKKPEGKALAAR